MLIERRRKRERSTTKEERKKKRTGGMNKITKERQFLVKRALMEREMGFSIRKRKPRTNS